MITRSTVPEFHLAAALASGPEYFVDRFGGLPSKRESFLEQLGEEGVEVDMPGVGNRDRAGERGHSCMDRSASCT